MCATLRCTQEVTCKPQERDADRYGRAIAVCSTTRTRDLNGWLVENGLAVAYREYSKAYVAAEDAARAAKLGIWKGTFEYPAQVGHAAVAGALLPAART